MRDREKLMELLNQDSLGFLLSRFFSTFETALVSFMSGMWLEFMNFELEQLASINNTESDSKMY